MEQGTIEWHLARLGKITASDCHVLMKTPRSKSEVFTDTAKSYLDKKVMENFLPIRCDDQASRNVVEEYIEIHNATSRAMEWGSMMESSARDRYKELMQVNVDEVGFFPHPEYPKLAGGSPDGIITESKGVIEIKCPFTLEHHLRHLIYQTPEDFKADKPEYYWQCIANMCVTDSDYCDFISYNPYVGIKQQLKVLRIPRNEEDIKLYNSRISLAVDYMAEKITLINKTETLITDYERPQEDNNTDCA